MSRPGDAAVPPRSPTGEVQLERMVRPLLALMQQLTGLETTFLTQIDWTAQQQTVTFSLNSSELVVSEGSTLPWNDSMCRWAFLSGRHLSAQVGTDFPGSIGAAALGMQTFFAVPVMAGDGEVIGTVCGASRSSIELNDATMAMVELVAEATACQMEVTTTARIASRRADTAETLALTDPLTGLANRRGFTARYEQELARSARHGGAVSLLLIDVDNFKAINDTHGHHRGDEVLRAVAGALEEAARAEDVPARIGGDEFAVALPHTGVNGAVEMASRVARLFAEATVEMGVSVTLSFGVCGSDTTPRRSMMAGADLALYRSKDLGRNRIEVWVGAVPDDPPAPRTQAVGAGT